ncbi:heterokaryon incompatibility protein-domain-containing protein [Microdochium trichocladiopsis]|uniref:Heterokaryon incompatibility protein-domain-containing protein n=1 Tax=Microdochium trichocladiopsis TaxID=1682393 RepID=A0A9P9BUI1_9PEZI|nr:heterokaryon incompatibility protein-domain-containing protein [Microdochium trichocladiopsis]KAH7031459.1 heterokaryon incompatibility protein-domain-containing protein [Microdochium trichocladiopsis]
MTAYQYRPLSGPTSIRIILLKPALLDSQPLELELYEAPLSGPGSLAYEALSYTWGERHGSIPIRCGGLRQTILVTPNCEAALRHLRYKLSVRQLWVDAICIDQTSVAEKNQQVPLMGKIYSQATRTVIWLGVGGPGDAGTLSRAKTVANFAHFRTMPGYCALSDTEKAWAQKLLPVSEIERIGRICQSNWFQRIWTVQEYLLAEHAIFMVGRAECPISQLYTYFIIGEALQDSDSHERRLFRMRSLMMEEMYEVRDHDDNSDVEPSAHDHPGESRLIRETRNRGSKDKKKKERYGKHWFSHTMRFNDMPPGGGLHNMLSRALQMASMSDATDARDKVYGMLAFIDMLCDDMYVPDVDYAKSLVEVYEEFAVCMIRSGGTLWPLEHISGSAMSQDACAWPSWVPDLREARLIASPRTWCSGLSRTPALDEDESWAQAHEQNCRGILRVSGRRMTRVLETFCRMPEIPISKSGDDDVEYDNARLECLSEWSAHVLKLDIETQRDQSVYREHSETYLGVLERLTPFLAYLRDRHEPGRSTPDTKDSSIKAQQQRQPRVRDLLRKMMVPSETVYRGNRGKLDQRRFDDLYDGSTLFLTECGLLGLCRGNVQAGDEMFQLAGGAYPFILRRDKRSRPMQYRLIGVASVDRGERARREGFWYEDISEPALDAIVLV